MESRKPEQWAGSLLYTLHVNEINSGTLMCYSLSMMAANWSFQCHLCLTRTEQPFPYFLHVLHSTPESSRPLLNLLSGGWLSASPCLSLKVLYVVNYHETPPARMGCATPLQKPQLFSP